MFVLAIGLAPMAQASEDEKVIDYMPRPITETPFAGRMLAMKMVSNTLGPFNPTQRLKWPLGAFTKMTLNCCCIRQNGLPWNLKP